MKPIKFDAATWLKFAIGAVNIIGMILASKADEHDRNALKAELKNDILKDLNPDK
jgi:hypothetical protein